LAVRNPSTRIKGLLERDAHRIRNPLQNWGNIMPVQQLAPPTLNEIVDDLRGFERKYQISTVDFLAKDGLILEVDDDDAVEWLYRVEQFRALQQGRSGYPGSRTERATSLNSCTDVIDVMDQLAA
jgi:hypothetical protein